MSENRKFLKILSLAQFVVGIVVLVVACVTKFGSGANDGSYLDLIACVALAILTVASSIMGIRGANRPSALGAHAAVSVVGALVGIASCVLVALAGGIVVVPAFGVVFNAEAGWLDVKVRKEVEERR